jgi:hypothetical protein
MRYKRRRRLKTEYGDMMRLTRRKCRNRLCRRGSMTKGKNNEREKKRKWEGSRR